MLAEIPLPKEEDFLVIVLGNKVIQCPDFSRAIGDVFVLIVGLTCLVFACIFSL